MNRERGEVRVGTIVWILVFVVVAIVCKEAIPVKIRSSQFQDYMVETAKFASHLSNDKLEKEILRKARDLDIPVNAKSVEVRKSNGRIRIRAEYTIPLEFPGYTYNWKFEHDINRPVFII